MIQNLEDIIVVSISEAEQKEQHILLLLFSFHACLLLPLVHLHFTLPNQQESRSDLRISL